MKALAIVGAAALFFFIFMGVGKIVSAVLKLNDQPTKKKGNTK